MEIKVDIAKTKVIVNVFEGNKHVLELKFKKNDWKRFEYLFESLISENLQCAIIDALDRANTFNIYKPNTMTYCKYINDKVLNKTTVGCDHGDCSGCPYKKK